MQTGGPAAALIGIITLLFIFYIIFLPPAEREALLEDDGVPGEPEDGVARGLLLDASPGKLAFAERGSFDHNIPNVVLTGATEAVILAQENPFVVLKGWFSEQAKRMVFAVPDLENTENVLLSFQAPVRDGALVVALNGERVFEGVVTSQNPPPVRLPKALLRASNVLEFSVQGDFWARRRFELRDVKVVAEVLDVLRQRATSTFTIGETEKENLERAFLDFFPVCDQRRVGVLTITLNDRVIYSAPPACDSLNRQDVFGEDLRAGRNTLTFRVEEGTFRIENIRVRTTLKEAGEFVEFFEVSDELFERVEDNERDVELRMEFVDGSERKRAEVSVNGRRRSLDQRDKVFERDISSDIVKGNNYVEIKPLTELNVVRLQVRVV